MKIITLLGAGGKMGLRIAANCYALGLSSSLTSRSVIGENRRWRSAGIRRFPSNRPCTERRR